MTGSNTYRKNSLRLKGFDYSNEGMYFVTILTKNREPFLGNIKNQKMNFSPCGEIVREEWLKTEHIRDRVVLGDWTIMPDHFHALIALKPKHPVRAHGHAPLLDGSSYKNTFGPQRDNLSSIVRGFKGPCTRKIRKELNPNFAWHRSFHDRIVRNQNELQRIEEYIINNPMKLSLHLFDF